MPEPAASTKAARANVATKMPRAVARGAQAPAVRPNLSFYLGMVSSGISTSTLPFVQRSPRPVRGERQPSKSDLLGIVERVVGHVHAPGDQATLLAWWPLCRAGIPEGRQIGVGPNAKVVIDVGGFLGIGATPVAVPLRDFEFMRNEDGDVLEATTWTKDQLNAMPEQVDS